MKKFLTVFTNLAIFTMLFMQSAYADSENAAKKEIEEKTVPAIQKVEPAKTDKETVKDAADTVKNDAKTQKIDAKVGKRIKKVEKPEEKPIKDVKNSNPQEIKTYSTKNIIGQEKSDKAQIKELFKNLNDYSNAHNIDAIKYFYSKDYMSFDGFNYDAFVLAIKETFNVYPDISYTSKIKSVNVYGNQAVVELIDNSYSKKQTVTQAIVNNKPVLNKEIDGTMQSYCHYVVYLKKDKNGWMIYSDNIINEETTIKYGKAENIDIKLTAPMVAKEGEEYCISLKVENKPKNMIMLASLSREEIKYPPNLPKDAFRRVPSDGSLERVVVANRRGVNEYSLASVGLTEISINEDMTAINYEMSGIAFLMKRVNVLSDRNAVNKEYLNRKIKETL